MAYSEIFYKLVVWVGGGQQAPLPTSNVKNHLPPLKTQFLPCLPNFLAASPIGAAAEERYVWMWHELTS